MQPNRPNRTINDEIEDIITSRLTEQAYPTRCTIIKTYPDGHTDIRTEAYGILPYVETIGNPTIGDIGVLMFLENDFDKRIVITQNTEVNTE